MIREIVTAGWKKEKGRYTTTWTEIRKHLAPNTPTGHTTNKVHCPYCRSEIKNFLTNAIKWEDAWYGNEATCPHCNNVMFVKVDKPYRVTWTIINEWGKRKYGRYEDFATIDEAINAAKEKFRNGEVEAWVQKQTGKPKMEHGAKVHHWYSIAKRKFKQDIVIYKRV